MNGPLNSFHLQCLRESEIGIERTTSRFARTASAWKAKKRRPKHLAGHFLLRESARSNVTAESTNV